MLHINEERFLNTLNHLAQIGLLPAEQGGGRDRRPFSAAEREARRYFQQQAEAVGLVVRTDAAANLSAVLPGESASARTLLMGSHMDTVPNGGPYDGALGVVAALEVLRTVKDAGLRLPVHLEAISFTDEEGRFGDFFGSMGLTGGATEESVGRFLANAGRYPEDLAAIRQQVPGGLTVSSVSQARRDPDTLAGYLEIHIEQGPQLENAGLPIGVVDAIFGRRAMKLRYTGRSDHAGTTPLSMRADALVAAARFISQAPQMVLKQYPGAVVTCGIVEVRPGAVNVIPEEAVVTVEFRAARADILSEMAASLEILAHAAKANTPGILVKVLPADQQAPVALDASMQDLIRQACADMGYTHFNLSSGALHDAGSLAAIVPSGLIFVPSIGGRSHSPEEDTAEADLIAGANVLLRSALLVAEKHQAAY